MAISVCILLVSGLATLATSRSPTTGTLRIGRELASSNNNFAFDLYKKIIQSNVGENIVLSPASIAIALAMIHAGAGGDTKSQIATAMHLNNYSSDDETINEGFKSFIETINRPNKDYKLQTANRLYGQRGHRFKNEYLRVTKVSYQASLEAVDFRSNSSGARKLMNSWVAKKTSNKIKELFPIGSITEDTLLVLVNAIYFNGDWLHKFVKKATKPKTFHLSKSRNTSIPTMTMQVSPRLGYTNSSELGCQVLELPYRGNQVSMFVFLPHDIEGLSSLESRLEAKSLDNVFRSVINRNKVKVSLPKFTLEHKLDLEDTLESIGIKDLFDGSKADLSGIDSDVLVVSKAIHKAFIAVNEKGTEATAATGFRARLTSFIRTIDFKVDRPFLFLLVEKTTGSILFLGRVTNPPKTK